MSAWRSSRCRLAATVAGKVTRYAPLLALCLAAGPAWAAPPDDYALVWSDEFTTDGLPDPARWAYDTEANATGWYNNEKQYYAVANPANSVQADGFLHITARRERLSDAPDYGGQDYSSARLITRGLATWTYAYVDARARLPCGQGTWPAIWMLGASGDPWPLMGEIDIMEHINSDGAVHGTLHSQATKGTAGIGGRMPVQDPCGTFHLYQMLWTPDRITISVDDMPYVRFNNPGTGREAWPYDQPFYLLVNLAIGGTWPGPVDDTVLPATFTLDYIRVYQK